MTLLHMPAAGLHLPTCRVFSHEQGRGRNEGEAGFGVSLRQMVTSAVSGATTHSVTLSHKMLGWSLQLLSCGMPRVAVIRVEKLQGSQP
jgi:hypothetical protein